MCAMVASVFTVLIAVVILENIWVETASAEEVPLGDAQEADRSVRAASGNVEAARRLIEEGKPEEAYRLLRRAMQVTANDFDTTGIRYMAARALLAGGHYAQAAQLLGRLAEDRPDLDGVQLDYATVLFTLGRDDEADTVFRDIRRKKKLPPLVQRDVEKFLERIRARQRWRIDFHLGFWHDDNVNNAPESETVAIPAIGGLRFALDQQPVRAWVARVGARFRWRELVAKSGRIFFETHASVLRDTAISASEYNRMWLSVSTGPRMHYSAEVAGRLQPGMFHADIGVERRWRGSSEYATSHWTSIGVEQAVTRNWRLGGASRLWVTHYDRVGGDAQPWGRSIALFGARRVGPGWLTVGGKISRETPERRSLRWTLHETWLRYAADFGRDWSASLRAGLTWTRFDAEEPLFLEKRKDSTHDISLTVSNRALVWKGYLPELALNWSRTESNIPIYDREVRPLRLSLRRLF